MPWTPDNCCISTSALDYRYLSTVMTCQPADLGMLLYLVYIKSALLQEISRARKMSCDT